nr:hypothetical protein [Synechococcus sp. CBW1004]
MVPGVIQPRTVGPSTIPDRISPITGGWPTRVISDPQSRDRKRITAI